MYKAGKFVGWLSVAVLCFSLGAFGSSGPKSDHHRHHGGDGGNGDWNAPEGGSALGYLALAAVSCAGAMALRRRQPGRGESSM